MPDGTKRKRISIHDIAKEANVSVTTVSRVLNNPDIVKEETRAKVQAIIDKNHFKPNELARSLFRKRSQTIGVILPDIINHFFAKIFLEIEKAALVHGQTIFLCNTLSDNSLEDFFVRRLAEKQVDGLLLLGGRSNESKLDRDYVTMLKQEMCDRPIVTINGRLEHMTKSYASVSSDEYDAMLQAASYLTKLGHRRIGFIGGKPGITTTDIKMAALRQAQKRYDFVLPITNVIHSDYSYTGGIRAMAELLAAAERPTAVIAVNDEVAAGAINFCGQTGVRVPEDLSVLGFDDGFISVTTQPSITTFSHSYALIGEMAVDFLCRMIDGQRVGPDAHVTLPMSLIKRNSCWPAKTYL